MLLALGPGRASALSAGDRAPSIDLVDDSGRRVTLRRYRGRVLIVSTWASWCAPCMEELPSLQRLYARHYRRGLRVLGVNVDRELEAMEQAKRELRIRFPNAHDPERTLVRRWGGRTIPMLWVIDGSGVVRHVQGGYEPGDERVLERVVRGLLPEPTPTAPDAGLPDAGLADAGRSRDAGRADAGVTSRATPQPRRRHPATFDAPPPLAPAPRTNRSAGICAIAHARPSALPVWLSLALALLSLAIRRSGTVFTC